MKTFQIYRTVSLEYFIDAETEEDAIEQIDKDIAQPSDEIELSLKIVDEHNGTDWKNEPAEVTT